MAAYTYVGSDPTNNQKIYSGVEPKTRMTVQVRDLGDAYNIVWMKTYPGYNYYPQVYLTKKKPIGEAFNFAFDVINKGHVNRFLKK